MFFCSRPRLTSSSLFEDAACVFEYSISSEFRVELEKIFGSELMSLRVSDSPSSESDMLANPGAFEFLEPHLSFPSSLSGRFPNLTLDFDRERDLDLYLPLDPDLAEPDCDTDLDLEMLRDRDLETLLDVDLLWNADLLRDLDLSVDSSLDLDLLLDSTVGLANLDLLVVWERLPEVDGL